MQIIRKRTYARAGLLGNPSDGYNGKAISISVRNFWSEVVLYEWHSLEIVLADLDRAQFRSVYDLAEDVRLHGYYGGIRLIKATIKRFVDYCQAQEIHLHERNFSIRYESNIPRQVGLAGSSSLIIATLRCLMEFYALDIPREILPTLALSVEMEELGIGAGLQDRVIQCYEGMIFMDFDHTRESQQNGLTHYHYERLMPSDALPLYVAYHTDLSEPTETFHNDIRGRFNRGETAVVEAMQQFAQIAAQGYQAIQQADLATLNRLIDQNFDTRAGIFRLPDWQANMVTTARDCGASAKFAGSGGAIIGLYDGEAMFLDLQTKMAAIGSRVIRPIIFGD
jgi:glucuronokinase